MARAVKLWRLLPWQRTMLLMSIYVFKFHILATKYPQTARSVVRLHHLSNLLLLYLDFNISHLYFSGPLSMTALIFPLCCIALISLPRPHMCISSLLEPWSVREGKVHGANHDQMCREKQQELIQWLVPGDYSIPACSARDIYKCVCVWLYRQGVACSHQHAIA